ncbi:Alpha/Beta hydrolase protein [Flagelloscypha sp. PMI_526]|nr:Alpha/Beta hydrolase protein [Flagelloscypha sp. PMI_526]
MAFLNLLIYASLIATVSLAASLKEVTNWGSNPSSVQMFIYVPDRLATTPAIVVSLHPCGGSASGWYNGDGNMHTYADQLGYILIYPQTTHDWNCWDVGSDQSLKHGGGGDSLGIVSMVNYTITTYKADKTRVFVMGGSSGAMMTNNLAGAYPDVFAAGASFSGWPYGCHAGAGVNNSSPFGSDLRCGNGQITHTGAEWAQLVHNAYPGYTGSYPRMQIWHGTSDSIVNYIVFGEQLKQWSTVQNVAFTQNITNTPSSGFTKVVYGDGTRVVGYSQQNGQHITPVDAPTVLKFFGLMS